jgi:hypothetical protein
MTGTERNQRHCARLVWLKSQPELLTRLPAADEDVTEEQHELLIKTCSWMQRLGLYSEHSESRASRWGIRRLVSELRGRRVEKMRRYRT